MTDGCEESLDMCFLGAAWKCFGFRHWRNVLQFTVVKKCALGRVRTRDLSIRGQVCILGLGVSGAVLIPERQDLTQLWYPVPMILPSIMEDGGLGPCYCNVTFCFSQNQLGRSYIWRISGWMEINCLSYLRSVGASGHLQKCIAATVNCVCSLHGWVFLEDHKEKKHCLQSTFGNRPRAFTMAQRATGRVKTTAHRL